MKLAEAKSEVSYSTGELSTFFGVSITSINNWIKDGRFVGISRTERGKQVRISEDSLWKLSNGKLRKIKDIVEEWNVENRDKFDIDIDKEKATILEEISYFDNKYGSFAKFMSKKSYTPQEERDKAEWNYWLKRVE